MPPIRRNLDDTGYAIRHWRGEHSLGRSFWINDAVMAGTVAFAANRFVEYCCRHVDDPIVLILPTVGALIAMLIARGWGIVGTWRSAGRSRTDGKRARAGLARLALGLGVMGLAGTMIDDAARVYGAVAQERSVVVPGITVRRQGSQIDYAGPIDAGAADRLAAVLATDPQARVLRLDGPGGSVQQARRMVALVRDRGMDTRVDTHCESACTIVFFAGRERRLGRKAKLGFHSYSSATRSAIPTAAIWAVESVEDRIYADAGVPAWFISRIFAVPPDAIWYPTPDELVEARFVTQVAAR